MSRARRRADRINEEVSILDVLASYGYEIHTGYDGEQQFRCDLHGTGHDNKPSARVYPDSNSTYCWACDRSRDPIAYVIEKEGVEFMDALKRLEDKYGLPPLPWEDDDFKKNAADGTEKLVEEALSFDTSYEDDKRRVKRFLDTITQERDLDLITTVKLWEAFDKVTYLVEHEVVPEPKGQKVLHDLLDRAKEKVIA